MQTKLRFVLAALAAAPLLFWNAQDARAQVQVQVQVTGPSLSVEVPPPPSIQFVAPPPLVVVSPGIQVVPDYEEEVFFVDNYYWVRRGNHWFRSSDHRGGWVAFQGAPRPIVRMKPGRYRKWHPRGGPVVVGAPGGVVVAAPGRRRGGPVVVASPGPGRVVVIGGPGRGKRHKHGRGGDD